MSSNHRDNTKNMNWRIAYQLWLRFCYETQNPTDVQIVRIIDDLQPILSELETTLTPHTVKLWFGNTRHRPYPGLSIQEIDSVRMAHQHLLQNVMINGAALRHLQAWLTKKRGPTITVEQKIANEQAKLQKKAAKPAGQPQRQHLQMSEAQQMSTQQPSAQQNFAYAKYLSSSQYWINHQYAASHPIQSGRQNKMGRSHVDEVRYHPYDRQHSLTARQPIVLYPAVQPSVNQQPADYLHISNITPNLVFVNQPAIYQSAVRPLVDRQPTVHKPAVQPPVVYQPAFHHPVDHLAVEQLIVPHLDDLNSTLDLVPDIDLNECLSGLFPGVCQDDFDDIRL